MTAFDAIVEPFVSAVIGVRCLMQDRLNVAAQLVCDGDPGLAKLSDQPCHEALGGLGIAAALDKDVELTTLVSQGTAASTKYSILTSPD